jgi:formylglycine-generating enzyme required for sulfatase activity
MSSANALCALRGLLIALSAVLCWPLAAADVDSGSDVDLSLGEGGRDFINSVGIKLVRIPKGKFMMGAAKDEPDAGSHEQPQHQVEISRDFHLGVYEVTQRQWKAVMGNNPSYFSQTGGGRGQVQKQDTDDFPVEHVSWDESVRFIDKLNALPAERGGGRKYRLPTEAEWEYACRAGDVRQPFSFRKPSKTASSTQANFVGTSPYNGGAQGPYLRRTSKAGSYEPNGFGLYDMHGNVLEWCSDNYTSNAYSDAGRAKDPKGPKQGNGKVLRGGAWNYNGSQCRSSSRTYATVTNWGDNFVGFRVACDVRRE